MPYSYNFDVSFFKSANLGILKDLKTLSNPNYKPFTTIINDVRNALDNDRMQPQQALIELKNRIFTGPGSLVNSIDTLFRKAFHFSSSPESVKLYGNISALIKQLYDKLFSPFAAKLAVYDPAKYNELLNRLDGALNIANQVEQSIKFLSTEMQSLKGIGSELPPRDQFEGPIPSMEQEEEQINKTETETDILYKDVAQKLNEFGTKLKNPSQFKQIKDKFTQELPFYLDNAETKAKEDPSIDDEDKYGISQDVKRHKQYLNTNFDHLAIFFTTGSFGKSENAYNDMVAEISETITKLGMKYAPDIEELLIADPFLLGRLVQILKPKQYGPGKIRNVGLGEGESSITTAIDNIQFDANAYKRQQLSAGGDPITEYFKLFEIDDRDDFDQLAQFVFDNVIQPVYREMMTDPNFDTDLPHKLSINQVDPKYRPVMSANRIGIKFALYQMSSNQARIVSLKNEYLKREDELEGIRKKIGLKSTTEKDKQYLNLVQEHADLAQKTILELMKGVLARCFPEDLVNNARQEMRKTFADDYQMLVNGPIETVKITLELDDDGNQILDKKGMPKKKSERAILYEQMLPYDQMLQKMAQILCFREAKQNQLFFFTSRVGFGRILSLAYGGLYGGKVDGSYRSSVEHIITPKNPSFFNRPVLLEPLSDKDKPIIPHNKVDEANEYLEDIEIDIQQRMRNKVNELNLDDETDKKVLFYLAFTEASSEFLKITHSHRKEREALLKGKKDKKLLQKPEALPTEQQEMKFMTGIWKKKYERMFATMKPKETVPMDTKAANLYIFPLKYLFK